ncbi:WlaTC/HtrL family glycosyltransferase [Acinetobacter baumannii]|uniref:WlaTC/HtrL family glycosyltransferase n=1 Tax=Acinetobacter baumannii TaxID=470 RepID=UPI001BC86D8D|nr:WlaTC/HtrL family glycosyltransferase [Acinetobacter baumannii]MDI9723937.1 WlaTC/HtrL family glycosyltransferase [Acinetobacter baumannii]
MNKKITVVTAFFDIGRENWTVEKGFPDYLFRTPDSYINYFKYLALLNNRPLAKVVIASSSDLPVQRLS